MSKKPAADAQPAEVAREYSPFAEATRIHGVSYDGSLVWCATGEQLAAFDPSTGTVVRALPVVCDAGTAFDGKHLYQLAAGNINKLDPQTGRVLTTLPAPAGHPTGLTWAEGYLWLGEFKGRKIHKLDPRTGQVLRTLSSDRFVTGVSFVQGELWHGTWEDEQSELRRVDAESGEVLTRLTMPRQAVVSGVESDGDALFFCGGGSQGVVRAVRRPRSGT